MTKRLLGASILALVLSFSMSGEALAQGTGTIAGTVTDAGSGEPLPGVNVVVEGTQQGAATAADGTYEITGVEAGTHAVTASFVGYADTTRQGIEVQANQTTTVDFALEREAAALEEMVVVGYGEQQRRDLTGAVSSVSAEEVQNVPVPSVEGALQGKMAGVQVRQTGGDLQGDFNVLVRGVGSTGDTQPLYVVDGVPLFSGALSTINPDNIASVEVLKDASAKAIYGTRAANGVVLITTKTGTPGETKVSYSADVGLQRATKTLDMMNKEQFAEHFVEAFRNDGLPVPPQFDDPSFPQVDNDWQDLVLRTAPRQQHNLSVTGGDQSTQFAVSGGYTDRSGILIDTRLQRISARINIDHQVNSELNVGVRMSGNRQWREGAVNDNFFGSAFRNAIFVRHWVPYKNENGEWAQIPPRSGAYYGLVANPVANLKTEIRRRNVTRFLGNAFAEYDIVEGLKFRSQVGTDLVFRDNYTYLPVWRKGGLDARSEGQTTQFDGDRINWVTDQTFTYNRLFGENHRFKGLLGFTAQQFNTRNLNVTASGTSNNNLREIGNQPNVRGAGGGGSTVGLISYFSRINYDYNDKYLLTATVRRDGSSRFGSGRRYGTFPSASAAWRISEEPFMQRFGFLDDLKLRTSYGLTGNQAIGNFQFLARAASDPYIWGDAVAAGNAPVSFANPNLHWEASKQFGVGLEATLFDGRLSLTADYYNKVSDDLLVSVPVPPSNGITNSQTVNVGSVQNRGVEFAFTSRNMVGDFSWTTNFNVTTNANEVLDIGTNARGEPLEIPGRNPGWLGPPANRTVAGRPIGAFYVYVMEGIWQQDEAEEAAAFSGQVPGQVRYKDLNGDGQFTAADRTFVGQPQPAWYGGMTNTFSYEGLTLSVLLNWQAGHKLLDTGRMLTENGSPNIKQRAVMVNRWTPENPSNKYPRATRSMTLHNGLPSTRFVEDASFLRVSNVSLGYSLPRRWLRMLQVDRAEITVTAINPFTFTEYSGLDPESSSFDSPLAAGIDRTPYPLAETYSLQLSLTF